MRKIATAEGAEIADDALALITRAAEGSARDATSLLDQAISHGAGETTADQVRAMLGLADRGRVLDLFDMILRGDAAGALNELSSQYADGADPDGRAARSGGNHPLGSVVKITPDAAEDPTVSPEERSAWPADGRNAADAGAYAAVADAAESAGRGRKRPKRDDGRRNGRDPADPCRRSAIARRACPQAGERNAATTQHPPAAPASGGGSTTAMASQQVTSGASSGATMAAVAARRGSGAGTVPDVRTCRRSDPHQP